MKSYRIEGLEVARPRGAGGRAFVADTWTPMQPFRECGCREGYCMPVATGVTVQNILKLFSVAETVAHTQGWHSLAERARRVRSRAHRFPTALVGACAGSLMTRAPCRRARTHYSRCEAGDEGSSNRLQICNMYRNSRPCRDLQVWPEFEPQCCRLNMTSV